MATARKLPSGSWRVRVFSHYEYVDGKKKPVYESFTSQDPSKAGKREVEARAAEFSANKDRMKRSDFTLHEAMQKYVEEKRNVLSPTTIRSYETLDRNAYPQIQDKPVKKISQEDIQEWANEYAADHSSKSVKNAHGFLSAVLSLYAPDLRLRTRLPAPENKQVYIPSDDDIKRLLGYVRGTELEKAVLLAAFGTLRRGEICALTDEDIHGNVITVNKEMVRSNDGGMIIKAPKTPSSVRDVEYPDFVIHKFDGVQGRLVKMHPEDISKHFGEILREAGLPHFRFHDLRHYSASIMHAIGVPDQYIMARGGWKTDRVFKTVYRNVLDDQEQKFTEQTNEHFSEVYDTKCDTK